ncbi:hypothetical protein AAHC03_024205 [Spirometra sp. Aus1]
MILLITGSPGTGKTTLVSRLAKGLKERATVLGFITEEVRDPRAGRLGFDVVELSGNERSSLARLQTSFSRSPEYLPRVGRYSVTVNEFEKIAIPCLEMALASTQRRGDAIEDPTYVLLDEIGKMELFSGAFRAKVEQLIAAISTPESRAHLIATIPAATRSDGLRGIPLVDSLVRRPNAVLREVTRSNRDAMFDEILPLLSK